MPCGCLRGDSKKGASSFSWRLHKGDLHHQRRGHGPFPRLAEAEAVSEPARRSRGRILRRIPSAANGLAEIDLGERIVVDLSGRDLRTVAPWHEGNLLFFAIGSRDHPLFGDLKIAAALEPRLGCCRQHGGQHDRRAPRQPCVQNAAHVVSSSNRLLVIPHCFQSD